MNALLLAACGSDPGPVWTTIGTERDPCARMSPSVGAPVADGDQLPYELGPDGGHQLMLELAVVGYEKALIEADLYSDVGVLLATNDALALDLSELEAVDCVRTVEVRAWFIDWNQPFDAWCALDGADALLQIAVEPLSGGSAGTGTRAELSVPVVLAAPDVCSAR